MGWLGANSPSSVVDLSVVLANEVIEDRARIIREVARAGDKAIWNGGRLGDSEALLNGRDEDVTWR